MNAARYSPGTRWRKSNYSNGMENCVEVADHLPELIPALGNESASNVKEER